MTLDRIPGEPGMIVALAERLAESAQDLTQAGDETISVARSVDPQDWSGAARRTWVSRLERVPEPLRAVAQDRVEVADATAAYGRTLERVQRDHDRLKAELHVAHGDRTAARASLGRTQSELDAARRNLRLMASDPATTAVAEQRVAAATVAVERQQVTLHEIDTSLARLSNRIEQVESEWTAARARYLAALEPTGAALAFASSGTTTRQRFLALFDGGTTPSAALVNDRWRSLSERDRQWLITNRPDLIGNTDGIDVEDRYAANLIAIRSEIDRLTAEADELDRAANGGFLEWLGDINPLAESNGERLDAIRKRLDVLEGVSQDADQILFFDADGDGRIAQVYGNLATADNAAIVVPGMNNDLNNFDNLKGDARRLYLKMNDVAAGSSNVAIAWLGYDTPEGTSAASDDVADRFDDNLRDMATELDRINPAAQVTVAAHSYGSVLTGHAMQEGLDVDRVAVVGSPGMGDFGHRDRSNLGSPDVALYAGQHHNDPVAWSPNYGEDPSVDGYGSTPFATDVSGHSNYYKDRSKSLENLARIAVGLEPR